MAHLETWYRCRCCNYVVHSMADARKHVLSHICPEEWAVSDKYPGKALCCSSFGGPANALKKADEPDRDIHGNEIQPLLQLYKRDRTFKEKE